MEDYYRYRPYFKTRGWVLKHRQATAQVVQALLDKPERREEALEANYVGVQVPNNSQDTD